VRNGTPISDPLHASIQLTRKLVVESWNAIGHALQPQGIERLAVSKLLHLNKISADLKTCASSIKLQRSLHYQISHKFLRDIYEKNFTCIAIVAFAVFPAVGCNETDGSGFCTY
jgi:hypothetical protein